MNRKKRVIAKSTPLYVRLTDGGFVYRHVGKDSVLCFLWSDLLGHIQLHDAHVADYRIHTACLLAERNKRNKKRDWLSAWEEENDEEVQ